MTRPGEALTDDQLLAQVSRLLSLLIEGFAADPFRCACGRLHRIGVSAETKSLIRSLWSALLQRSFVPVVSAAARHWFAWLEYD